jgi:hypothetical protein
MVITDREAVENGHRLGGKTRPNEETHGASQLGHTAVLPLRVLGRGLDRWIVRLGMATGALGSLGVGPSPLERGERIPQRLNQV